MNTSHPGGRARPSSRDVEQAISIDHPKDGAIALAHSFVNSGASKGRYVMPNQYESPDNVKAHYETTGPEIWGQTEGQVKFLFADFGTCGTATGIGRYVISAADME